MLWSIAHMLANGDLAHVILFGLFALFSGAAMHMIDRRKQREMGQTEWQRLSRNTALLSLRGLRRMSVSPLQVVAAALVFAGLLWLHPVVIGVSPMP
ncbi:NnrU family protein [Jhaorihella thermophila]